MQQERSIDIHDIWDKIWRDKHGHIVIWQMPNVWLFGWVGLTVVSLFFNANSAASTVLSAMGSALLVIWSLLEILKGVNYFRRAFGLVVLVVAIASLIKSF